MFSYRVFDGDLTDRGIAQARQLAEALRAAVRRHGLLAAPLGTGHTGEGAGVERRTFCLNGGPSACRVDGPVSRRLRGLAL